MAEVVLVASGGGHLEQLKMLAPRLGLEGHQRWITFDTPQSRSLLAGEDVTYVPYMAPRDYRGLTQNLAVGTFLGSRRTTTAVVSTGAGLALAYLPSAALRGIPSFYIESATRVVGPSITGRALARCPRVRLYTQHQRWATSQWGYPGSVFEGFSIEERPGRDFDRALVRRAVVSLGTIKTYQFRRLVERLSDLFGESVDVTWQTGSTEVDDLPIDARAEIPHAELVSAIEQADVLVAHAGTGIALTAFRAGVCPVLVPREARHREHIDDHQAQTARLLSGAGLAISRSVDELSIDDILLTASKRIVQSSDAPQLRLRSPETSPVVEPTVSLSASPAS